MSEVAQMGKQASESVKLLGAQIEALIKRVAAKDEEFARERRVLKEHNAKLLLALREARSELKKSKPAAKKGDAHVFD